ncbi:hypothetical protein JGB26_37140 [Streptomyces flavofungini]|uniref:Uncharacterized protein n=1 Tax=Streptomyces flavofungini TaxID=68200 RepID=A0ABS0XHE4_9ACTN|nr:hypothetical protein [Streptomyces flavofungini]
MYQPRIGASGGAGVRAPHAHPVRALLQITGLIHDQHRIRARTPLPGAVVPPANLLGR